MRSISSPARPSRPSASSSRGDGTGAATMGEFDLIRAIRDRTRSTDRVAIGIGDDCASVRFTPGSEVLVTTDLLMDGRHFRLEETTPEQVGIKCMGVNLSDIAAMAGTPIAAV